ncbi:peptidase inhibitor 16 [Alosa sapidissima]|uniref:peptidase inhibitor 16 n=1 Tax=Alosa sapidissima TaxID=34773 RepID=UPI001C08A415|nr:peptidase inhibitor 16 [Alosa sapidissima]
MFCAGVCACVCALLVVSSAQLSEDHYQVIVDQHNLRRTQVIPSAVYMKTMSWDERLRIVAEGYAAKCRWDHNPELEDLGENLYITNGPLDPEEAIEKWFNEHENYNYTSNECAEGEMCGHYTQVVWADSHKVGCAAHQCVDIEGLPFGNATILVCNYYPAGNYEGEKPYTEGEFCSSCPEDMPRCTDALCAPEETELPSEEPDLTDSWATDSSPSSSDVPGTAPLLPLHTTTPAGNSAPEVIPSSSPSPAGEEAEAEGTSPGEEGAAGSPRLEEVSVEMGLDEALMSLDRLLDTQTSRSRIMVKSRDRNVLSSAAEQRVWSGMLLLNLIGLVLCLMA